MNSAQEALYKFHQLQSEEKGSAPLPYDIFCARLLKICELTGMLLPGSVVNTKLKRGASLAFSRVNITSEAAAAVPADEMRKALQRHAAGDWGLLDKKDWRRNDLALRNGGRLFSIYKSSSGQKFCVVTRPDRAVTMVSIPAED